MMHSEHGKNAGETMKLGEQIDVTPVNTPEVEKLRVKGAAELAKLVPLTGNKFGNAYINAMVKGHTEALEVMDKLLNAADNDSLKKHRQKRERLLRIVLPKPKGSKRI